MPKPIFKFLLTSFFPFLGLTGWKYANSFILISFIFYLLVTTTRLISTPIGMLFCVALIATTFTLSTVIGMLAWRKIDIRPLTFFLPLAYVALIFLSIFRHEQILGLKLFYIPSESMKPTLEPGDFIVSDKWAYLWTNPRKGDVVVFHLKNTQISMVKRLIKIDGDLFDARGDNPKKSITEEKLRNIPINKIRGEAKFVLINYEKGRFDFGRLFRRLN